MTNDELVTQLVAALEERGAPDAIALTDLIRVEQNLVDALRLVRQQIDALVRRASSKIN
jgi:hypothetical protein